MKFLTFAARSAGVAFAVTFASLSAGVAAPLSAQNGPSPMQAPAAPPASTYHGRTGQLDVRIPKIQSSPTVDGKLDEATWSEASILTGFSQYNPVDRLPANDSTEVLVM